MQALVVQSEIAVDYINDMPTGLYHVKPKHALSQNRSKPYHRIISGFFMGTGL